MNNKATTPLSMPINNRGFTLIELLVVVALIGLMGLVAIPSVSNVFKVSLNSATRDMATKIRETYNAASMTKRVHRMVFDFKTQQYWVEIGPPSLLLETEDSRKKHERALRFGNKDAEEIEKQKNSAFTLARPVNRKPSDLPRGVEFEDVITEQSDTPIKEGQAYVHFFPHGMTEKSIIHLKDNSNHKATLVIPTLVGRTKVFDHYVDPKELEQ